MRRKRRTPDALAIRFARKLKERLGNRLLDVILFGSRARGDFREDSDYDLLAVVDVMDAEVNDVIDDLAGEFLYEYDRLFPVVAVPQARYDRETLNPLFMNVKKEGVVVSLATAR